MATTDTVELLGTWWSPFVLRVRIALKLKSVEYDFIEEPLVPKSELLLKYNPVYKKVPVFFHNHRPILESALIVQYIDDFWTSPPPSPPIFPSDPYDRATALFWSRYIDDKIFPILGGLFFATHEGDRGEEVKKLVERISPLEDVLLKMMSKRKGDNKFFGGERIGWLDIALGSFVGLVKSIEACNNAGADLLFAGTPALSRWAEDFAADDAVGGLLPPTEKLVEFAKGFSQILKQFRSGNPIIN